MHLRFGGLIFRRANFFFFFWVGGVLLSEFYGTGVLLSGDAHARRPLHKMDGVFFLSDDAHARRPLHKMDGVFFKRRRACASTAS